MTLITSSEALLQRLTDFEISKSLAKEAQGFHTRAEQFARAAADLQFVASLKRALVAQGIAEIPEQQTRRPLAAKAAQLAAAFEADPASILAAQAPGQSLLAQLTPFVAQQREWLSEAWRSQLEDTLGLMPDGLLKVIEPIGDLALKVRQIRQLQAAGRQIAATLPAPNATSVEAALAEARSLAARKSAILETLTEMPEDVLRFLERSTRHEARLNEVNASVVEWLTRQHQLDAFLVVPG